MNGDIDWEHIGCASRADSKTPICNLGRGVVASSDRPEVVSSGEKSSGVSSSTLKSVMVWTREKGYGGAKVV